MRQKTRPHSADQNASEEIAGAALLEASTETALGAVAELNSMAIAPEHANVDAAKVNLQSAENSLDTIASALKSLTGAGLNETNPAVALLIEQRKSAEEAVTAAKAKVASAEKSLVNTQKVAKYAGTLSDIVKYAGSFTTENADKLIGKVSLAELFAGEGHDLRMIALRKADELKKRAVELVLRAKAQDEKAIMYAWLQKAVRRAVNDDSAMLIELTDPDLEMFVSIRDAGNSLVDIIAGRVSSDRRTSSFPSALTQEHGVTSWDALLEKVDPDEHTKRKSAIDQANSEGKSTARSSHEICAKLGIGHPHDGECPYA